MRHSYAVPYIIPVRTLEKYTQIKILISELIVKPKNKIRLRITDNCSVKIIDYIIAIHIDKPNIAR